MYSGKQIDLIAYEVARAGFNIAKAASVLREQYETFREIGESTIHRLMRKSSFVESVAKNVSAIQEAHDAAVIAVERTKALREVESTLTGQMRANDRLLDDARKNLEKVLHDLAHQPDA